ncbi:MAG: beta-propeller fold lactonase family protein [Steroidobacteraceae bacterium]
MLSLDPLGALAARAYVSNEDGRSVSVLDAGRGKLIATVPVGKRPRGLKLSHDGSRLYVAVSGVPKCPPSVPDAQCAQMKRDLGADGIAVVDTRRLKLIGLLRAGSDPEQLDLGRAGRRLYISNEDGAAVTVVDIPTAKVVTRIPVGHAPEGARTSPNGDWIGITSETDNTISLIDSHLLEVAHVVPVGLRPRDLAFSPDGRTAYATCELGFSVYRFAVPSGRPIEKLIQLRPQDRPMGILLDAPRRRLYVSTGRGGTIAVIGLEGPRARLIREIPVGARPWGIALTRNHRLLFTANGPSNDVSIVDTATLRVVKKVPVGRSPWGVVIGP